MARGLHRRGCGVLARKKSPARKNEFRVSVQWRNTCPVLSRKIFYFRFSGNYDPLPPSRAHERGGRVVTNVERGMRWTWWRRATSDASTDGEGVWSWHPWAGAKRARDDSLATVTNKRSEEHT